MKRLLLFAAGLLCGALSAAEMTPRDAAAELKTFDGEINVLDLTETGEAAARRTALRANAANPKLTVNIRRRAEAGFAPDVIVREAVPGEKGKGVVCYAANALRIVVNQANTLDELSIAQLKQIYSGEFRDWKKLTGSPYSIHRYGMGAKDPATPILEQLVLKGAAFAPLYRANDPRELQLLVSTNAHAIGFLATAPDPKIPNLKVLRIDGMSPLRENIATDSYALVRRRVVEVPGSSRAARAFAVLFLASAGESGAEGK